MDSFWDNLIGHFKTRSAGLFVPVLLAFFGLIILGGIIYDKVPHEVFFAGLTAIGLVALMLVWWAVRRARRRGRYDSSPLSRDEMDKARSKLVHRNKLKI